MSRKAVAAARLAESPPRADLEARIAALTAELDEAREQRQAASDVLRAIAETPGDAEGTLRKIAETTNRLFKASSTSFRIAEGDEITLAIGVGHGAEVVNAAVFDPAKPRVKVGPATLPGTVIRENRQIHLPDLDNVPAEFAHWPGPPVLRAAGTRSLAATPLRREGRAIGAFIVHRDRLRPFAPEELELLQSFADQAVIAIENARFINETRQRTEELQESLEYQTATSDVLQAISRSTFDLDAILHTVAASAERLCRANYVVIFRNEGGEYRFAAGHDNTPEYEAREKNLVIRPGRGSLIGRAVLEGHAVQIADAQSDPEYEAKEDARINNAHTMLGVPLLREGQAIGAIGLARNRVEPFSEREVQLVTTFADQAAIAIENARLITETREALEQQTATAEVLGVINASPGDLAPVFDAILEKAMRLCGAAFGTLFAAEGDVGRLMASSNVPEPFAEYLTRHGIKLKTILGPEFREAPLVHIEDLAAGAPYRDGVPIARAAVDLGGIRSFLVVPLVKDGSLTGIFAIYRQEIRPFSGREIALVRSFTDQAVIAMENARLLGEIRSARDAAESALGELKLAQANLIQAEKMASLGQLTAGIAHEIKNPLNFVNNFATLSNELLGELKEIAAPGFEALGEDARADVDETMAMLSGNLDKIAEHGRRADGIVKSMLAHSRGSSGERQSVDLNALAEEALNLAYHGARAQDQSFNITLERDFAAGIAPVEVAPQDVTRVLLNLIGNGFHAAHKRFKDSGDPGFRPLLRVATRELGDAVEVRVRDNGTGIPAEIRDKLFQPFFTTKPTGEGTGLGLSISYDIVTQQHGGTIAVESEVGTYTEFTVRLPRRYGMGDARTMGRQA